VHAANMEKIGPEGKPLRNAQGKITKPEGWERPEPKIIEEVRRQMKEAKSQ